MVRKFIGLSAALLPALIFAGACSSQTTHPADQTRGAASASPRSTSIAKANAPAVIPTPPPDGCGDPLNIKLLSSVANTGGATVAAVVNINAAPVAFGSTSSLIAVDSSNVIAGTLTNGTLDNVETSTPPDEASLLPPGKYAVLLGPVSDHPGDYYLADGLAGSFELNGSNAVQRCRNIDDPSKPLVSSHEVGWGDLRNLLASALDTVGATSSSSSSGGG